MSAKADEPEDASPQGLIERTLAVLELLAHNPVGLPLYEVAERLRIPRSATHRVLTALVEQGYVRQERTHGDYRLTTKIASLGFMILAGSGITDLAQPILDRVARETRELARLAVRDDANLTFVAKAQGSPQGLRYDPDMGQVARLSCSASGIAWLATMPDEEALAIVHRQGFGSREQFGPNAPQDDAAFLVLLHAARSLGYAVTVQTYSPWMASMAVVVRRPDTGEIIGALTVAGPHVRLTEERMHGFAPMLVDAARELSLAAIASPALSGRRSVVF